MAFRDIRKSRKWLSAEELRLLALILLFLAALLAGNIALARILPGGEWLFLRWSGARAFLADQMESANGSKGGRDLSSGVLVIPDRQTEPYGTEIAQSTQEIAYGRPAFSSEYTYVLNDPFFIVLFYIPLALLRDFTLARAVWLLVAEAALIGTVVFAFRLSEWRPPGWLYGSLLGFGLLQYFSLNALVTATPAIILAFLYLSILLCLRSHFDELAGALLALVAYQWEVGGLFFLYMIVFIFANRRWHVLAGLAMALFVLLVVSFLTYPGWGLPYIRAVLSDWYRGENLNFGHILSTWLPNLRFSAGRAVSIGLGIILFVEWIGSVNEHFRRIVWTASLSLAATPLMGFAIFPSHHVVLILPFILILALVWERWQRYRVIRVVLLLLLMLFIPFGLYLRAVFIYDALITDLISVLAPVGAILGLYWMRWWVLHSPRALFNRIGDLR